MGPMQCPSPAPALKEVQCLYIARTMHSFGVARTGVEVWVRVIIIVITILHVPGLNFTCCSCGRALVVVAAGSRSKRIHV